MEVQWVYKGASGKGGYGWTRTRTRTRTQARTQTEIPFSALCSVGQKLNMVIHSLKLLAKVLLSLLNRLSCLSSSQQR